MTATKSTRNLTKYNKQQLVQQLDSIAQHVADRGVYFAVPNANGFYDVIDYIREQTVVHDVPTKQLADHIGTALNQRQHFSPSYLRTLLDRYHKLINDCLHYRHTLASSTDHFKLYLAQTRLDDALIQLDQLGHDLTRRI